ncbi:indole-3-glycerol phosphate synthase [Ammoniphilus oxalaticus]|uniref:Indole-3-glycerol phosphate synthase n=1 Tax=Ammoniphilus oxalaticus TaxID=66863 RepID=A0A419SN95_9BACL|nr:indole-3-glycerol phosphate synthase TrpC [Ammoniphilus oxalaticus]RKD25712.1 indole-3-glycerol phosphate synthase [Ammoniphilus oxalaticus]
MLHKIIAEKRREVESLKRRLDHGKIEEALGAVAAPLPFVDRLLSSKRKVSVIAEVKKASPSKGVIRPDFDPLALAQAYADANVEAMSVLTDEKFFQGNNDYLTTIKREIPTTPLLRKDFIIDPLQVYEARLIGADCILLIAAALEPRQLSELADLAAELGMDTLIEVHNEAEIEQTLAHTKPSVLGINNRDLKTFETTLKTTERLMSFIPSDLPVISESGIRSREDIDYLAGLGARGVLVGEHFMRQQDITVAVKELVD